MPDDPVVPLDPDRLAKIVGIADADRRDRGLPPWRNEYGKDVLALVAAAREAIYRGHEASEEVGVEDWKRWASSERLGIRFEAGTKQLRALLARLDDAEAALASPEGVVTLPKLGQRVRITTDGGMDHVGEVIRYGDPEGNVRTLFMVALDDGSSGYFLDDPSWHWTLVPYRPEDTKGAGYE